jgi:hypothetical protein
MLQARYPKGSSPSDNGKPFKTVRKTSLQIQSAIIALENSTAALPPVKPAIKIPLKAKNCMCNSVFAYFFEFSCAQITNEFVLSSLILACNHGVNGSKIY